MANEPQLKLKEGDIAPSFTAATNGGGRVSLSDYKGQNVILYFYPKDILLFSRSTPRGLAGGHHSATPFAIG